MAYVDSGSPFGNMMKELAKYFWNYVVHKSTNTNRGAFKKGYQEEYMETFLGDNYNLIGVDGKD